MSESDEEAVSSPSVNKESLILKLINVLLSALATTLGSFKDFPLGVIAGMTAEFILISIIGALLGTILALKNFRRSWILGLISVLAVPAVIYYSYLLTRGGLNLAQILLAALLYLYVFFAASFLLTYFEMLITPLRSTAGVESASLKTKGKAAVDGKRVAKLKEGETDQPEKRASGRVKVKKQE